MTVEELLAEADRVEASGSPRPHVWTVMAMYPISEEDAQRNGLGQSLTLPTSEADVRGPFCMACEHGLDQLDAPCAGDPITP